MSTDVSYWRIAAIQAERDAEREQHRADAAGRYGAPEDRAADFLLARSMGRTFENIAAEHFVTRERARQIVKRGLNDEITYALFVFRSIDWADPQGGDSR